LEYNSDIALLEEGLDEWQDRSLSLQLLKRSQCIRTIE